MFIFRNIRYSLFLLLMIFLAIGNNVYSQKEVLPFTKSDSALITKLSNYQKHFKSNGNKKQESRFLDKLAFLYWRHFMLKEAEGYYNKSLENYKSINDKKLIASTNTNLALLNSDIGNYAKSINYFDKAIKINKVGKHKTQYINNLKDKATVLSKQKKYITAIESVNTALKKSEELKDNSNIKECYGMLAEFYKKSGDNEKSLFYYKKFLGIKDDEQIADNTTRNTNIEDNSNHNNNNPDNTSHNNDNSNNLDNNNNNSTDSDNNENNTTHNKSNDSNSGDNDLIYDDAINNHNKENPKDTNQSENKSIDESDSLAVNNSDTSGNLSSIEDNGEAVVIAKKSRLSCQNIILIALAAFVLFVLLFLLVRKCRKKAKNKDNKKVANVANLKVKKSKQNNKIPKKEAKNSTNNKTKKNMPFVPDKKEEKNETVISEIKEKKVEKEQPIKVEEKKDPIIPIVENKPEKSEPVKQDIEEKKTEKEQPIKVEEKKEPIIPIVENKPEKSEPVKPVVEQKKVEKEKTPVGEKKIKEPFDIDGLVRNVKYKDNFDLMSKFLPGAFLVKVNENRPCLISVKKENSLSVFIVEETKGRTCEIDFYENLIKTIETSNLPTEKLIKKISSFIKKVKKDDFEYNLACLNFDINKTTIEYTGANLPLIYVKNKIPHLLSGNSGTLPLSKKYKPFEQNLKLSGDTNFYVISRKFYVNKVINQEYIDTIKRTISGINSEYTLQEKKDILEQQVSNIVKNSDDNSGIILGFKA